MIRIVKTDDQDHRIETAEAEHRTEETLDKFHSWLESVLGCLISETCATTNQAGIKCIQNKYFAEMSYKH